MQTKMIKVGVLALSLAMLGGCAGDMKQLKADVAAASAKANDAYSLATKSQKTASDAALAAAKAQATADEALACCKANSDKIDRMFEKAMAK